ncbi:MAG: Ig-like domain-containing protein [Pseudomonadota bacterium]
MISDRIRCAALTLLCLGGGLGACTDGNTEPLVELVTIENSNIQGITVTSSRDVISVGESLTLSAVESTTGEDLRERLTWSSSNTAVATVDATGTVTGVADGTAVFTGRIGNFSGAITLTVSSASLTSIDVTSDALPIDVCQNAQFVATGTFADGRTEDLTQTVTWASDDSALATFDDDTPGQLFTTNDGTVNVTASEDGVTSAALPVVVSATLSSVSITLTDTSISAGGTTSVSATGNYSGTNRDITGNSVFTSSDETVATTDRDTISGIAEGTTQITGACNGLSNSGTLTVTGSNAGRVVDLDIDQTSPVTIVVGANTQLTATAEFEDGSTEDVTTETTWTVQIGSAGAASVSNVEGSRGQVSGLTAGTSIIRAEFEGEDATITVQVTAQ